MSLENSQIAQFFKNQTIFITGGTGFLGKLLIEKLLRTCWDLKKIYVLMRSKSGKTPQQRFDELFNFPCFDLIRGKKLRDKVFLISGDCKRPLLGLSDQDLDLLKRETTCFFHVAANVKFDISFKEASYNVSATRDVVNLTKQMSNLKVFIYVSTAYSNCINSHIAEEFYKPPMDTNTFLNFINAVDDDVLQNITHPLLGKWPNTYVYSKCITENLIKNSNINVPVAIIRPSIIMNTIEEPIKGWIDNTYGLIGITFGACVGVVRSFYAGKNNKLNLVPADHVCNCVLAATWKAAITQSESPVIYNCVGEPKSCEDCTKLINWFYWEFPSEKYLWYKSFKIIENKFWNHVYFSLHLLPAYFIDLIFFFFGKSARIVQRYTRINRVLEMSSYFATRDWTFDEDNVISLWKGMSDEDKKIFKFNVKITDWYAYFRNCALGKRLYLLNDPIDTVPKGQKKLKVLFVLHYAVIILLCYFMFATLMFMFGF
ncbi:fatty acyl-CoA reductase wat-like [Zophobas morio]|uniref:fatty acyl-CoA reductase wat-like n=1 Tax=Zophobas morio TaxID=2755281 RepID=UPI0030836074